MTPALVHKRGCGVPVARITNGRTDALELQFWHPVTRPVADRKEVRS